MNKFIKIIISITICEGIGIMGSVFTIPSINGWYAALNKPVFSPPNWVFGPVWILLYLLMGIAIYLVWEKGVKKNTGKKAIVFFVFQLLFNFFWSVLFFGLHFPLLAFLEIVALWVLILMTIAAFMKVEKTAAYLLTLYILWVSFALILNLSIVLLN